MYNFSYKKKNPSLWVDSCSLSFILQEVGGRSAISNGNHPFSFFSLLKLGSFPSSPQLGCMSSWASCRSLGTQP